MSSNAPFSQLCDWLQRFGLPAGIAELRQNRLVSTNEQLRRIAGYSAEDLRDIPLTEIIVLEHSPSAGPADFAAGPIPRHGRCALKHEGVESPLTGYFLERPDGLVLLMFDSCIFIHPGEEFFRGRIAGRTEENRAIRDRFHENVSQQLVAAALAVESLSASLLESCPNQANVTERIALLLNESILGVQQALRQQSNLTQTSARSTGDASE